MEYLPTKISDFCCIDLSILFANATTQSLMLASSGVLSYYTRQPLLNIRLPGYEENVHLSCIMGIVVQGKLS